MNFLSLYLQRSGNNTQRMGETRDPLIKDPVTR